MEQECQEYKAEVNTQSARRLEIEALYEKIKREVEDCKTREKMMARKAEKYEKASLKSKKDLQKLEEQVKSLQLEL